MSRVFDVFKAGVAGAYDRPALDPYHKPAWRTRQLLYAALIRRFGPQRVLRHIPRIKDALNRYENRIRIPLGFTPFVMRARERQRTLFE